MLNLGGHCAGFVLGAAGKLTRIARAFSLTILAGDERVRSHDLLGRGIGEEPMAVRTTKKAQNAEEPEESAC